MNWMTASGSVIGFLSLGAMLGLYAYGLVADRRGGGTRKQRDYLRTGEEAFEGRAV
jgi:hypothetical protein